MTGRATSPPENKALADLAQPLAEISDAKFREIVSLLEEVKSQPAVQQVMATVRFRMKRVRPPRKPTLQRLFYEPAEDLLTDSSETAHTLIQRAVMTLAWNFIENSADPAAIEALTERLVRARAGDRLAIRAVGQALWPQSAALLGEAAALAQTDRKLRRALLGDNSELFLDLKQLIRVLSVGGPIAALKEALPAKPFESLSRTDLDLIRKMVMEHGRTNADRAYGILVAVMVRAAVPSSFVAAMVHLTQGLASAIREEVIERLNRYLLSEMSGRAAALEALADDDIRTQAAATQKLVVALAAGERAMKANTPEIRGKLDAMRKTAETRILGMVDEVQRRLDAIMPLAAAPPVAQQIQAEASLLALRQTETYAGAIGLDGTVSKCLSAINESVRRKATVLFGTLRKARQAQTGRAGLEQEIYWTVRLLELTGDLDLADQIRREGLKLLGPD